MLKLYIINRNVLLKIEQLQLFRGVVFAQIIIKKCKLLHKHFYIVLKLLILLIIYYIMRVFC